MINKPGPSGPAALLRGSKSDPLGEGYLSILSTSAAIVLLLFQRQQRVIASATTVMESIKSWK
jgi:hypothetical protein